MTRIDKFYFWETIQSYVNWCITDNNFFNGAFISEFKKPLGSHRTRQKMYEPLYLKFFSDWYIFLLKNNLIPKSCSLKFKVPYKLSGNKILSCTLMYVLLNPNENVQVPILSDENDRLINWKKKTFVFRK